MNHFPILLFRHGETVWNRAGILQGQTDSPLTLKGVAQARRMGRALAAEIEALGRFRFFASPIGRALQTATLIADTVGFDPAAIRTDRRLAELDFGLWNGLGHAEIKARFPEEWAARQTDRWTFRPTGGESFADVGARLEAFFADLGDPQDERPAVIVAHGALNQVFRGLYLGTPPEVFLGYDEPQDGFYRLESGTATFVPSPPEDAKADAAGAPSGSTGRGPSSGI